MAARSEATELRRASPWARCSWLLAVFYTAAMAQSTTVKQARAILGDDVLGPEELRAAFGGVDGLEADTAVPFTQADLEQARDNGELLVLRAAAVAGAPLTLLWLIQRFPESFDHASLRKMGYQLRDDWGIELEPLAATDTCQPHWALVRKDLLPATRNLTYDEHDALIDAYGVARGAPGCFRRRSGIEIAFDLIVYQRARATRLLSKSWDWSSSRTIDGGFLNIGRFNDAGMQVFSYSRAVRHGQLGVCPTRAANW